MDREPDQSDKVNEEQEDPSSLQEMQGAANIATACQKFTLININNIFHEFKSLREMVQRLVGSRDRPSRNLVPPLCISDLIGASLESVHWDRAGENPSRQASPDIRSSEPTRDTLPEQDKKIAGLRPARKNHEHGALQFEAQPAQQSSVPQVVRQLLAPDSGLFERLERGATPEGKLLKEIDKIASS